MSLQSECQKWISFDHNEDENVCHARRQSTQKAADFLRIQFANHDPGYYEKTHRTGHGENKDAGYWNP